MNGEGPKLDDKGQPVPILDTYTISPLTLDDIGFVEQHLLAERATPEGILNPLLAKLSPMHQEMLLNIAYKDQKKGYNKVTREELAAFVDTVEGQIFTFWQTLRKDQPQIKTLEHARALFECLQEEEVREFIRRRNIASGTDSLGNLTGRSDQEKTSQAAPSPGGA